jgi:hypothetical protein
MQRVSGGQHRRRHRLLEGDYGHWYRWGLPSIICHYIGDGGHKMARRNDWRCVRDARIWPVRLRFELQGLLLVSCTDSP